MLVMEHSTGTIPKDFLIKMRHYANNLVGYEIENLIPMDIDYEKDLKIWINFTS